MTLDEEKKSWMKGHYFEKSQMQSLYHNVIGAMFLVPKRSALANG